MTEFRIRLHDVEFDAATRQAIDAELRAVVVRHLATLDHHGDRLAAPMPRLGDALRGMSPVATRELAGVAA